MWRKSTQDNKKIEIWSSTDDTYLIFEGNFLDSECGEQDVTFVSELDDVRKAIVEVIVEVSVNYTLLQNEEPREQVASVKYLLLKK